MNNYHLIIDFEKNVSVQYGISVLESYDNSFEVYSILENNRIRCYCQLTENFLEKCNFIKSYEEVRHVL